MTPRESSGEPFAFCRMFEICATGHDGTPVICQKLNAEGYRKRSGKKWDRRMVLFMLRNPIYAGRMRWNGDHAGSHPAIVNEKLFNKVAAVHRRRAEDFKGRQWHPRHRRYLTGIIECGRCGHHMIGGSSRHNVTKRQAPYYICTKRWGTKSCDQDYIRADRLEATIIDHVKTIFRDEAFVTRIWDETNRLLGKERPGLDKEITRIDTQMTDVRQRRDRYFQAFEAGTMKPEACREKVEELSTRLRDLKEQRRVVETRRKELVLPALDRAALAGLLNDFDRVIVESDSAEVKDLLQRLVTRVVVRDRGGAEVWYAVPGGQAARTLPAPGETAGQAAAFSPQVRSDIIASNKSAQSSLDVCSPVLV